MGGPTIGVTRDELTGLIFSAHGIWDVVNYEMIMGKLNLDSMVNNKAEK